ncbi:MAG TPA: class I SAM-dependent methyltransferase, partial [Caldisericia bacterium]|nr:class I SAM-dependent methyltransferase [Caldisericia bacterium]
MKNERILIHDFDLNLICDYFGRLERQGPGSIESTIRALSFIDNFSNELKIADLACGTGGQTITLAQNTKGTITGLDISPDFIEKFNTNAKKLCLQNRVKGIVGSMDNLPFQN